jgi:RNA ligase (TIGR02306 family)
MRNSDRPKSPYCSTGQISVEVMSSIKVEVTQIQDIRPHSNADSLDLATVGGWQMCVRKGAYQSGDPIVYFEQGTALPREMADRLGVTQYLSEKTDINGDRVLVIHRVKLRGEPSFGLVVSPEPEMELGADVAEFYGATKYHPPLKSKAGDAEIEDPRFPVYTDIENMRSYPNLLVDGEDVIATEKIHGTNCRVGFVANGETRILMAGSKGIRRKEPIAQEVFHANTYWHPHSLSGVSALLDHLWQLGHRQAVLFGEVYGKGVQSYAYGQNSIAFRAFDLMVDGQYLDHETFVMLCKKHDVETVPVAYQDAFSLAAIKDLSDGDSLVGGVHGREGVVVKPAVERQDIKIGRVILKYVGDVYLFGKSAQQDTTDL